MISPKKNHYTSTSQLQITISKHESDDADITTWNPNKKRYAEIAWIPSRNYSMPLYDTASDT